jgi:hypothetical protein
MGPVSTAGSRATDSATNSAGKRKQNGIAGTTSSSGRGAAMASKGQSRQKSLKPFGARNASSVRFGEAHRPPLAMALVTDELRHGGHLHGGLVAGGAAILSAHRFDATFAIGGRACRPRILGIGANSGHHEHRNPNTRVATDARG